MKTWFSSDWHLDHANVIKYDNRPFKSVSQMNQTLIFRYNELVKPGDNFYFLGDFSFNVDKVEGYLQQMNGNKFFIKGNHDKKDLIKLYQKYGIYLGEQKKIVVQGQDIVLNHYSMEVWDRSHHGSWHLYGHSHGSLPDNVNARKFDIGCMLFDYKPIDFETVEKIMNKKNFVPIDHHK